MADVYRRAVWQSITAVASAGATSTTGTAAGASSVAATRAATSGTSAARATSAGRRLGCRRFYRFATAGVANGATRCCHTR